MSWKYTTVALRIDIAKNIDDMEAGKDVKTYGSSGMLLWGNEECYVLSL